MNITRMQEKAPQKTTETRADFGIPLEVIHSLVWLSETRVLVLIKEDSVLRVQELSSDRQGLKIIVDAIRSFRSDLPVLHYGEAAAA